MGNFAVPFFYSESYAVSFTGESFRRFRPLTSRQRFHTALHALQWYPSSSQWPRRPGTPLPHPGLSVPLARRPIRYPYPLSASILFNSPTRLGYTAPDVRVADKVAASLERGAGLGVL